MTERIAATFRIGWDGVGDERKMMWRRIIPVLELREMPRWVTALGGYGEHEKEQRIFPSLHRTQVNTVYAGNSSLIRPLDHDRAKTQEFVQMRRRMPVAVARGSRDVNFGPGVR